MHFAFLNLNSVDGLSSFSAPEISNEVFVFFFGDVEFSLSVVFKLWVVNHFLWDSVTSEEPDSFDVKVWFFSENGHH